MRAAHHSCFSATRQSPLSDPYLPAILPTPNIPTMKEQTGRNQNAVKVIFHCDACSKEVEVNMNERTPCVRLDAIDDHYIHQHGVEKKNTPN
ncbi:hypothetical protein BC936DRAFT_138952 [Jimgerdemannia flammicorona]|uniref:Uncharacterized protein n=1 Tax=Jimgerdemannia flammicorona TaxID=994334 RepID=A0A433BCN2_9FUNG|nr:hypothetical protein BC936DRAFT_138952 [Jimgerdemannia flammicorona]